MTISIRKHNKKGELHCDDGPALVEGEITIYYRNGKIHRDGDLPAYITPSFQAFYQNGLISRETKTKGQYNPALIPSDSDKEPLVRIDGMTLLDALSSVIEK